MTLYFPILNFIHYNLFCNHSFTLNLHTILETKTYSQSFGNIIPKIFKQLRLHDN